MNSLEEHREGGSLDGRQAERKGNAGGWAARHWSRSKDPKLCDKGTVFISPGTGAGRGAGTSACCADAISVIDTQISGKKPILPVILPLRNHLHLHCFYPAHVFYISAAPASALRNHPPTAE